jgi:hypothetical protein
MLDVGIESLSRCLPSIAFGSSSLLLNLFEPLRRRVGRHLNTWLLSCVFRLRLQADQLGDRIGIMQGGKLKCCGSSLFLKRK